MHLPQHWLLSFPITHFHISTCHCKNFQLGVASKMQRTHGIFRPASKYLWVPPRNAWICRVGYCSMGVTVGRVVSSARARTRDDTPHGDPHATVTHPAYSGTFRGRRIYVFACTVHFVLRKILPCERRKELWIGEKLMKGAYLWLVMFSFDECIGQWRILSFHKRCSLLNFSTSEVKNVLELKWTCDQR